MNSKAQGIAYATCLFSNAAKSITDNKTANDLLNKIDVANKTEQKGLLSGLFGNWMFWVVLVGILIMVVAGGGWYLKKKKNPLSSV